MPKNTEKLIVVTKNPMLQQVLTRWVGEHVIFEDSIPPDLDPKQPVLLDEEVDMEGKEGVFYRLGHDLRLPMGGGDLKKSILSLKTRKNTPFQVGNWLFNPEKRTLGQNGDTETVRLTEKEVAILAYLAAQNGESVPSETLMAKVWGYHPEVTSHTLQTHIYKLRQKLETDPEAPAYLVTDKAGYKLITNTE